MGGGGTSTRREHEGSQGKKAGVKGAGDDSLGSEQTSHTEAKSSFCCGTGVSAFSPYRP